MSLPSPLRGHPPGVWTVAVGWTSHRPVRPDEHTSHVLVAADDEWEAQLLAAQMVATIADSDAHGHRLACGRPGCVMPTSTRVVAVEF